MFIEKSSFEHSLNTNKDLKVFITLCIIIVNNTIYVNCDILYMPLLKNTSLVEILQLFEFLSISEYLPDPL